MPADHPQHIPGRDSVTGAAGVGLVAMAGGGLTGCGDDGGGAGGGVDPTRAWSAACR